MGDSTIPQAVWSGEFRIGKHVLRCHVLDDGRRIIDAEDFNRFFLGGGLADVKEADLQSFAADFGAWMRQELATDEHLRELAKRPCQGTLRFLPDCPCPPCEARRKLGALEEDDDG